MGRTTLVVDESLLEAAMQLSGMKTKTEAIELALREFVRRKRLDALTASLGTYELDIDLEELRRLRAAG